MSNNGVKLQINSLQALERLIGGDSELELELRRNVADVFIKNHYQAIAREMAEAGLNDTIGAFLKKEFVDVVRENYKDKLILKGEFKTLIQKAVKEEVDFQVKTAVIEAAKEIKRMVQESADEKIAQLVLHFANHLAPDVREKAITQAILKRLALAGEPTE